MQYTTIIPGLNLKQPNGPVVVHAKQNDMSRWFQTTLLHGDQAWTPPSGAAVMIRYRKPDGTAGWYDTLEDGTSAVSLSGSTLTFGLAAQALAVAGRVKLDVSFYVSSNGDVAERVSTFNLLIEVEEEPLSDAEIVSDYYFNVLSQQINGLLGATTHPPKIDSTSLNWLLWDENDGDYSDSGYSSIGTTGPAPTLDSTVIEYVQTENVTTIPTTGWSTTLPTITAGKWLWTRVTLNFGTSGTSYSYSVAHQGVNGSGAVSTVNSESPDANGNVAISASDIPTSDSSNVQATLNALAAMTAADISTSDSSNVQAALDALKAAITPIDVHVRRVTQSIAQTDPSQSDYENIGTLRYSCYIVGDTLFVSLFIYARYAIAAGQELLEFYINTVGDISAAYPTDVPAINTGGGANADLYVLTGQNRLKTNVAIPVGSYLFINGSIRIQRT